MHRNLIIFFTFLLILSLNIPLKAEINNKARSLSEDMENSNKISTFKHFKKFYNNLYESIKINVLNEHRYLVFMKGLKITILISLLSTLIGTLFGAFICYLRMQDNPLLSLMAKAYIKIIGGIPELVLLLIFYYVIFTSDIFSPVFLSVLAFGLNFAARISEIYRTSIESVDTGQNEAGIASGFNKIETFIYIILPQALKRMLPLYEGRLINLIWWTSVVGYIAIQDLTMAGKIVRSQTMDSFIPFLTVGILYMLIAWLVSSLISYIDHQIDPINKRNRLMQKIER